MDDGGEVSGRQWPKSLKISSILAGVAIIVGLLADVDSLIGIPGIAVAGFFLCLGAAVCGLGAFLYGREWGNPIGWRATRAVGVFTAGVVTATLSLAELAPDVVGSLPGVGSLSGSLAWQGPAQLTKEGLDFDVAPPAASGDIDIYSQEYDILALDPAKLIQWPNNHATFAECAKGIDEALEFNFDFVINGETGCVRTNQGKIVFFRVTGVSYPNYRLDVMIFK